MLLAACGAEQAPTSALPLTEAPSPTLMVSQPDETITSAPTVEAAPTSVPGVEVTSQPAAPIGGALTGLQALELALPKMQDWQADAKLIELGTTIMAPVAPDGTCTVWTASFYSASAKAMNGVMIQNGQAVVTAEIPTEYEAGRLIDPIVVKLDSDEVMRIAEANGGGEYSAQEDIMAVAVLNYQVAYEKVVWVVNYQSQADYTVVFTVHIDAASGEVLLATKL